MLYICTDGEPKEVYEREGVYSSVKIGEGALDAELVDFEFDKETKTISIVTVEDETARDIFIISRFGLYPGIKTQIQLLFLDENTAVIKPDSGAIFVGGDEDGNGCGMLDIDGEINKVKRFETGKILWIEPKDILSLVKGGGFSERWGKLSDRYPYDHFYTFEITADESSMGKKIKCLYTKDISEGYIEMMVRHESIVQYQNFINGRNKSMHEEAEKAKRAAFCNPHSSEDDDLFDDDENYADYSDEE